MNKPSALSGAPSGGTIDGVDLHNLGVMIEAIDSRGMPPRTANRIDRPGGHGAIILPEFFRPRPLTVSGKMFADSHADMVENQEELRTLLARYSRSRTQTAPIQLVDPVDADTTYFCTYIGPCIFQDIPPRAAMPVCRFAFSVLANPPWRQGPETQLTYTAAANSHRHIPIGNAESAYRIFASGFAFPLRIRWGKTLGLLLPRFSLDLLDADGADVSPALSPNADTLIPSKFTSGQALPIADPNRLRYNINLPLGGMTVFLLIEPRADSSTLTATELNVLQAGTGASRIHLTVSSHAQGAKWKILQGTTGILEWDGPQYSAGDRITIGLTCGQGTNGYTAGASLYYNGARVAASPTAISGNVQSVFLGCRSADPPRCANINLHVAAFFASQLSSIEHQRLALNPEVENRNITTYISAPSGVTSGKLFFDTRDYTGQIQDNAGNVQNIFPNDGSFFPPLTPDENIAFHHGAATINILYRASYL